MRLLGVRTTSTALGFGLLAAGLGVLGAGSSGPAQTKYEVTAPLQLATGGKVFACYAFLMTYPAEGCGGIEVRGVDFSQIPNVEGYPSGAQVSEAMRLVGTWDGKTPGVMAREPEVWAGLKAHGIAVLQTMPCDDRALGVTVAVADDDTVAWVTSHYQHIKIAGWLQPLPSGP